MNGNISNVIKVICIKVEHLLAVYVQSIIHSTIHITESVKGKIQGFSSNKAELLYSQEVTLIQNEIFWVKIYPAEIYFIFYLYVY